MRTIQNTRTKINERIASVKHAAVADWQMPDFLQKKLENIYRQPNKELVMRPSSYKKEWGKDVSGF